MQVVQEAEGFAGDRGSDDFFEMMREMILVVVPEAEGGSTAECAEGRGRGRS